jgi:hypothetical protein
VCALFLLLLPLLFVYIETFISLFGICVDWGCLSMAKRLLIYRGVIAWVRLNRVLLAKNRFAIVVFNVRRLSVMVSVVVPSFFLMVLLLKLIVQCFLRL